MTLCNEKAHHGTDHIDRISDLPSNVMYVLLSLLPIKDLVRTSILSRKWRYKWTSTLRLEFDYSFFSEYEYSRDDSQTTDIINEVLLVHDGPVNKFTLNIPTSYSMRISCFNKWMLFLSRCGLKELELVNHHWYLYQVPSNIFACQDLTYLELYQFGLSLPPNFHGFKSLNHLRLYEVRVASSALENLVSSSPCLEELFLSGCSGIECINISSPSLRVLHINGDTGTISLKNAKNIVDLTLLTVIHWECCEIESLLKLERLSMLAMNIQSKGSISQTLKRLINSLKYLELNLLNFDETKEVLMIIGLLESCHNLEELAIKGFSKSERPHTSNMTKLGGRSHCLSQLKTVDINVETSYNYKIPLAFIRFVLASSPSLETLKFRLEFTLQQFDTPRADPPLSIQRELSKMERASQRAKVKFIYGDLAEILIMTSKADHANHIDRISDLPSNVMDVLLSRLPIKDLVRTSVLSRKWRYKWTSTPRLEFDYSFFSECKYSHDSPQATDIINEVLWVLDGPVNKFILHIPTGYNISTGCLNKWMLFLSRRGLKELELVNYHWNLYQVPSNIFACQDLTYLELHQFGLSLPPNFHGFKSLNHLHLYEVRVECRALENLISSCPCLEELFIVGCSGLECLIISSPSLRVLYINGDTDTISLKNAKNIVGLTLLTVIHWEHCEIEGLLKLERLSILPMNMQSNGSIPQTLKRFINSLKYLELNLLNFDGPKEVLMIIALLESCHNLEELAIKGFSKSKNRRTSYLKELGCSSQRISQLKTVDINVETARNYKIPLSFVRFVLANAPSLVTLKFRLEFTLRQSDTPKADPPSRIKQDLLKMERASQRAKVKFIYGDLPEMIV